MPSHRTVMTLCCVLAQAALGCSSGALAGSTPDEAIAEESFALPTGFLQSVWVYRAPSLLAISALDSQNALPSGLLVEPTLLGLLKDLANSRLTASSPEVAALARARAGAGRVLLKYVSRCALRESDKAVLPDAPGRLGLAPEWQHRSLNGSERRWLTACLMAHTNNLASVPIALTGTLPMFSTAGSRVGVTPRYPHEEAAFFGDLLGNTPQLFACGGAGTQALCSDRGAGEDLQRRICGTESASDCGFKYLGECNELGPAGSWLAAACSATPADAPYADCAGSDSGRFSEVVTTSLRTDVELLGLHPACGKRPTPSCSPPAHDVCTMGEPLGLACSERVCESDPYCCLRAWDSSCVAKARAAGYCL